MSKDICVDSHAYYRPLVGVVLLLSGARLLWPRELKSNRDPRDPPIWVGVLCGVIIGFLSGLTGTGGGIFLSPILLFLGWSETRTASGVAAFFILCNSVADLLGNVAIVKSLPPIVGLRHRRHVRGDHRHHVGHQVATADHPQSSGPSSSCRRTKADWVLLEFISVRRRAHFLEGYDNKTDNRRRYQLALCRRFQRGCSVFNRMNAAASIAFGNSLWNRWVRSMLSR